MTSKSLRVGAFDVAILSDGIFEAPLDYVIHLGGEDARTSALARWGQLSVKIDVNAFLLRDASGPLLIDAGTGTAWGPGLGGVQRELPERGIAPETVERILLTHIHGDHALGLFDGDGAFFPNAQVIVPQTDLAFFTDPAARESVPEERRSGFDIAKKLQQAYGPRLRPMPAGDILPGIEALPLPGHTPGHTGYLIRGESETLLIWADALHITGLQGPDPDAGLVFDNDPETAARTRRDILARAARENWIVAGCHIHGFNRVETAGEAFQITPLANDAEP